MPSRPARFLVTAAICGATFWSGCASGPKVEHDHSFIAYWPPKEGDPRPRLAVKDLIDLKGTVTSAGSAYLARTSPPAKKDAKCLAIARQGRVQIVGKANTTELAVGVSGVNPHFGTPRNPLTKREDRIPGGSSSGSAVAVANSTADVAFGTDTAGSIRVPAACCGVAGLKTTFGLISLDGVYPIAPTTLDTVGPLAKDTTGLVLGMELLEAGFASKLQAAQAAYPSPRKLRIGRLYVKGTDPKIDQAIDATLAAKGFQVVPLDKAFRESWEQAEKDGRVVAAASAWIYDQRFRGQSGVAARTKAVFTLGELQYKLSYPEAMRRRPLWQATLARTLQKVDLIALPTLKTLPPKVPWFGGTVAFEARVLGMQNTVAVNLAGNPALAIPVRLDDSVVPVTSLQLIGPKLGEAKLLQAGRLIEGRPTVAAR